MGREGACVLATSRRAAHVGNSNAAPGPSSAVGDTSSGAATSSRGSSTNPADLTRSDSKESADLRHVKSDLDALEGEWAHLQAEARLLKQEVRRQEAAEKAVATTAAPPETTKSRGGGNDEEPPAEWPEPTLADLDRSIPQVDCEFIANLIRSRNLRRDTFLKRKTQVKARVQDLTRQTTKSIKEAVTLPRVGGLQFWRNGIASLQGEEETALAAISDESPVLASEEVLAQLTPEELDILQTSRPEYDDGFILLDCRTVNEVTSWGIIEGAKVLPAHELFEAFHSTPEEFQQEYGFSKPRPDEMIICYCQYGPRSLMAAQILSWMGYLKVLHFRDGYYEWGKQYNLLLRRWMEHDKASGNELRRVAAFRAALELQRDIAPEFNALPMKEAAQYEIDTTRSRGTLRIGDGLRTEAYQAVAKLIEGLPETKALPGHLEDSEQDEKSRRGQHLTQFLEQTTGLNPLAEADPDGDISVGEAQSRAIEALTEGRSSGGHGNG